MSDAAPQPEEPIHVTFTHETEVILYQEDLTTGQVDLRINGVPVVNLLEVDDA